MAKFSRVLKFKGDVHTISHAGSSYAEEHEGTGLFEAPHDHADHFVGAGFAEEYAGTMEEALEKLTGGGDTKAPEAAQQGQRKKL